MLKKSPETLYIKWIPWLNSHPPKRLVKTVFGGNCANKKDCRITIFWNRSNDSVDLESLTLYNLQHIIMIATI